MNCENDDNHDYYCMHCQTCHDCLEEDQEAEAQRLKQLQQENAALKAELEAVNGQAGECEASLAQLPSFINDSIGSVLEGSDARVINSEIGEALLRLKGDYTNNLEGKK